MRTLAILAIGIAVLVGCAPQEPPSAPAGATTKINSTPKGGAAGMSKDSLTVPGNSSNVNLPGSKLGG